MNANQTAIDAYLVHTVAVHTKLEQLSNSPTTISVTTPMPTIGATSAITSGCSWRFSAEWQVTADILPTDPEGRLKVGPG
jgi:hypothetical protein